MCNYFRIDDGEWKPKCLFAATLLFFLLVLSSGSIAGASEAHSLLQFKNDRVTGVLRQISLREVLEQFHNEFAIEYIVPGEELDKHLSADLFEESVPEALSKILASWDYALQVDHQERVQQIFVVAKMEPLAIKKDTVKTPGSKKDTFPGKLIGNESIIKTSKKTQTPLPEVEVEENSERDAVGFPMFLRPSEALRPMVIQPPQGGPMIIQPSSHSMEVIPASGFLPMEILPVSEDARMEFFEEHN